MSQGFDVLLSAAREVQQRAYAPYSRFRVGAALETEQGTIFSGCNIENASFGVTMCAERVAIGCAIAAGQKEFRRLVLVTDAKQPESPCGACRQAIIEFAPDLEIISVAPDGNQRIWKASELLPDRFILPTGADE
jgi:cytidine deaminase